MTPSEFTSKFPKLPGAMPIWHGNVDNRQFRILCELVKLDGGRLVALWGSDEQQRGNGYEIHTALVTSSGMLCLTLSIDAGHPAYPDVSDLYPAASRMQRAVADLLGLHPSGADDQRAARPFGRDADLHPRHGRDPNRRGRSRDPLRHRWDRDHRQRS